MATAAAPAGKPETSAIRSALPGLLLAMLLAMLDAVVVSTALPAVVADLGGFDQLSWVVAVYLLTSTVSTPIWGKIGDLLPRKTLFVVAIVVFLGASALCGVAQSMLQLIIFRAVQGIGAGGLIIGVMTAIGILAPPAERGRYQGYIAALSAVATIGGPLLGGALTDGFSWRWAFYINIPIGLIALALIITKLQLPEIRRPHKIDYLGAVLLTVVSSSAILVAVWGGTRYGWGSATIVLLAVVAVVSLVATIVRERRTTEPILSLDLFRSREFTAAVVLAFLVGVALYGSITFIPLYEQNVHDASATTSGLLLIPLLAGQLITSIFTGRALKGPAQYRPFSVAGGVALTVGAVLLSMVDTDTNRVLEGVYMFVFGIGIGFLFQNVLVMAQNSVAPSDIGSASGVLTFFRSIGGTLGVSIFAAIFTSRLRDSLTGRLPAGQLDALSRSGGRLDSGVLQNLPASARGAYLEAVAHGIQGVFGWAILVGALAIVAGFLVRGRQRQPEETPAPAGAAAG
jgi:EmrB/QacA subfamily drug resistance transporter